MANKTFASICVLVLVLNLISTFPAHANWFGKRGDQDDILGYLLKNSGEQQQQDTYLSDESALMAIERILMKWKMARKMGIATQPQN